MRWEMHTKLWSDTWREEPLGRRSLKCKDNIKIDLKDIGYMGVNMIYLAQDRDQGPALVKTVVKLRVPYKTGNFLQS
jgi:hypothetical protein